MNKYQGNKKERLALDTFTKLVRAAETITAAVHGQLAGHNLSISQFGILEALYHLGPMCQRDIAVKILKSTGNITMVIDNLEKRQMVRRMKNEKDRRFYDIHLTESGRDLIASIFPAHAERIVEKMSILSDSEQTDLGRLCRKFKSIQYL